MLRSAGCLRCAGRPQCPPSEVVEDSNRNSDEGQDLSAVCKELGLTRLVREPNRGGTCSTFCYPASLG